jgi:hypothetical protein
MRADCSPSDTSPLLQGGGGSGAEGDTIPCARWCSRPAPAGPLVLGVRALVVGVVLFALGMGGGESTAAGGSVLGFGASNTSSSSSGATFAPWVTSLVKAASSANTANPSVLFAIISYRGGMGDWHLGLALLFAARFILHTPGQLRSM